MQAVSLRLVQAHFLVTKDAAAQCRMSWQNVERPPGPPSAAVG